MEQCMACILLQGKSDKRWQEASADLRCLPSVMFLSQEQCRQILFEKEFTILLPFPGLCYVIVALILIFAYPLSKNVVQRNGEILTERRNVAAEANGSES